MRRLMIRLSSNQRRRDDVARLTSAPHHILVRLGHTRHASTPTLSVPSWRIRLTEHRKRHQSCSRKHKKRDDKDTQPLLHSSLPR